MLKIIKSSLIFVLAVGLALPFVVPASPTVIVPALAQLNSVIAVTSGSPEASVVVENKSFDCLYSQDTTGSLVQDKSVINLHQGSDCLSTLTLAVQDSVQNLAVVPYFDTRPITVVYTATMSGPEVAANTGSGLVSVVLPGAVSVLFQEVLKSHTLISITHLEFTNIVKISLNLAELQILRC